MVDGVVFFHDGTMLASTGFETIIRIWGVASGEQRFAFDKGGRLTTGTVIAFSPERGGDSPGGLGQRSPVRAPFVRRSHRRGARERPLYEEVDRVKIHHGEIDSLDVARRQPVLAVGSRDGAVTIVRWKKKAGP